jgi:MFS family permease
MRTIPILLFSPTAGVAIDRVPRNRIIAISQFAMFVLTFVVAIDLALGRIQIWHLFLFTFLVATAQTFNLPARQTFVFDLVPRRAVPNAVALSWFAFSLARSIGPAVGGLLIVLFDPANNLFLLATLIFSPTMRGLHLNHLSESPPYPEHRIAQKQNARLMARVPFR